MTKVTEKDIEDLNNKTFLQQAALILVNILRSPEFGSWRGEECHTMLPEEAIAVSLSAACKYAILSDWSQEDFLQEASQTYDAERRALEGWLMGRADLAPDLEDILESIRYRKRGRLRGARGGRATAIYSLVSRVIGGPARG